MALRRHEDLPGTAIPIEEGSLMATRTRMLPVLGAVLMLAATAAASTPPDYSLCAPPRKGALLRAGASGGQVSALQHALAAAHAPANATGTFDAATVAAVKSFQASRHIAVDGIVGPETMRA